MVGGWVWLYVMYVCVGKSGFHSGAGNVFVPRNAWQGLQISPLRFH
jgi:hypothetical protein